MICRGKKGTFGREPLLSIHRGHSGPHVIAVAIMEIAVIMGVVVMKTPHDQIITVGETLK